MKTIKILIPDDIKDPDLKALMILESGMRQSTPKMRKANLKFVADKWKIKL